MPRDETTRTFRDPGQRGGVQQPDNQPGLLTLCSTACAVGTTHALADVTSIGRGPDQRVFLDDPSLSRAHAELAVDPGGWRLRDLGSRNGTFVNGERVDEALLRPAALLRVGSSLLLAVEDIRGYAGWPQSAQRSPLAGGPTMERVRGRIAALATMDADLFVSAESGAGKEIAARLLHDLSGRPGAFVPVNCAALPESLAEAELFGAARGAYTGASVRRGGLLRAANRGTVFLDEIAELPLTLQPKLLRAVEQREVRALGDERAEILDLRFVTATHKSLDQEVQAGRFRADLLHRLCGATVEIPPLRQRRDDIAVMTWRFLRGQAENLRPGLLFLERIALEAWSGNVRELQRALREAVINARLRNADELSPAHLPRWLDGDADDAELQRVCAALRRTRGNVARAALELGLDRSRVYGALRAAGRRADEFRAR